MKPLELKRRLGDEMGIARRLGNIGAAYAELGRLDEALDFLQQAHQKHRDLEASRELVDSHHSFARLHQQRGDLTSAVEAVQRSIELAEEVGRVKPLTDGYGLLADLQE
ncbi:MAG: tetratricopeptide repeat protein, partial [Bosea sp.]|uniref:tetratricopeptide repeat protein n=1 Tax=Bosea sp. (in: a-proteobacteria) TaxID=1871050 RepID=UPI002382A4BD|nr:tetratricopeptide repeat protein [Bosea sp. (in: a-proteobacteria)]